jgi:hypothetical protein
VRLRRQLVGYRTALTNQFKAPGGQAAKARPQSLVDTTASTSAGSRPTSMPWSTGISDRHARRNHHRDPRLRPADRHLAGLAPHPYDSGERRGYRRTRSRTGRRLAVSITTTSDRQFSQDPGGAKKAAAADPCSSPTSAVPLMSC